MKTQLRLAGIVALAITILFGVIGYKNTSPLTSVKSVAEYLANTEGSTSVDNPLPLKVKIDLGNMTADESGWQQLLHTINRAGRFVALDLSQCKMAEKEFNFSRTQAGKKFIVSLTLPNSAKSVKPGGMTGNYGAPDFSIEHFNNLQSLKARNVAEISKPAKAVLVNKVTTIETYTVANADSQDAQSGGNAIIVSNAREFLEALGSNRVIEMKPGYYNLSNVDGYVNLQEGVEWDGNSINVNDIGNLTIRGTSSGNKITEIVIESSYEFVMYFYDCHNIVIEDITAGHAAEPGTCGAGVFQFTRSSNISMTRVKMYGSGTEGLVLQSVNGMKVYDSQIYECSNDIMLIYGYDDEGISGNISFEQCLFYDNGGGVYVSKVKDVTFKDCKFRNNSATFQVNEAKVSVFRSSFSDYKNYTSQEIANTPDVKFYNCLFD
jgi:hypothetical protein